MQYYDQHLHTYLSYDSREQFENYLKLAEDFLVTTEHLDLRNIRVHADCLFDYDEYRLKISELNQKYPTQVLAGIEVGYLKSVHNRTLDFLRDKEFDIKLLSFHQTEEFSFLDPVVYSYNPIQLLQDYLGIMLAGIKDFNDVNVLAHFDFGIRLLDIDKATFIKHGENYLIEIFKEAISHNIALELNTRSMYDYDKLPLYDYAIDLYKQLGGDMFVLSSDAHSASYYNFQFEEAYKVLQRHQIKYLTVFQRGKPIKVAI